MKIYSIYNNKGGVGKTTTTKYFAKFLSKLGKKVLLIDLDPQANLTSQFLLTGDTRIKACNTTELLLGESSINELVLGTFVTNVDIVPAHISLLDANNKMLVEAVMRNPSTRLAKKLEQLGVKYEYVLIDCPPTMDLLVSNALACSTDIVIPVKADGYSADGIAMLLGKIDEVKLGFNNDLKISKVFLNQYKRTNNHRDIFEMYKKYLQNFSEKAIGDYVVVSEDTLAKDDDSDKLDGHKIQKQFDELFTEILEGC